MPPADDAPRPSGRFILVSEDELQDLLARSFDALAGPHGFHKTMSMFRILRVQSVHQFRWLPRPCPDQVPRGLGGLDESRFVMFEQFGQGILINWGLGAKGRSLAVIRHILPRSLSRVDHGNVAGMVDYGVVPIGNETAPSGPICSRPAGSSVLG